MVHDLDVAGVAALPPKVDGPLVVDPAALLADAVTFESFEPVAALERKSVISGPARHYAADVCAEMMGQLPIDEPLEWTSADESGLSTVHTLLCMPTEPGGEIVPAIGTELPELYEELARSIRVRHLQTPLANAVTFAPSQDRVPAMTKLAELNLDHAPVTSSDASDHIIGYVSRASLYRSRSVTIGRHIKPAQAPNIISADASLDTLMRCFAETDFLLVLDGNEVTGLVTPADLDRQACRACFYVLLAGFEVACADLIRRYYANDRECLAVMNPERAELALNRYEEAASQNTEADVIAYLNPADLVIIIGETPRITSALGLTKRRWTKMTSFFPSFRNDVVHPVRSLIAQSGAPRLLRRKSQLVELLRIMDGHG